MPVRKSKKIRTIEEKLGKPLDHIILDLYEESFVQVAEAIQEETSVRIHPTTLSRYCQTRDLSVHSLFP